MKQYSINENYIASDKQTIFTVQKPFINDTISVFVNGDLQVFGTKGDYVTIQETGEIIFNMPLEEGDKVAIRTNVSTPRINLEIVSAGHADRPNALYKKYGTVKRLKSNNKYEVNICLDKEIHRWNFISKLNPLFCSSKKIWEDIGEFIEGFTEEYINSMLYRSSVEVIELIDELKNAEDSVENVTYSVNEDGIYETTYRTVKNWVRLKTEIDLILARYYGKSQRYGSIKKEIGDISIENNVKLPYIDQLLKRIERDFTLADDAIKGANHIASAVKGSTKFNYQPERTTNF